MSFERKWRNFQRITEAKGQATLTDPFQKKMKARRRRNDVYTKPSGHRNLKVGSPFTTNADGFGKSNIYFENLQEKIEADTLKSFEVHDTFEPEVWEGDRLSAEVRAALMKIADDFLIDLPFDLEDVKDITLTGSLANYNWSKYSDVDLHIVLDFTQIDENLELVRQFFRHLQTNWNNKHDILMKGYEVEIYFQDSNEPHISTGVYSVQDDEWIVKPTPEAVSVDYANIKKKAEDISDRIDHIEHMLGNEEDSVVLDSIDRLRAKIRNMRKTGLEGAGQYSVENLAFKVLRRSEELGRLAALKVKAYDELMSIEQ